MKTPSHLHHIDANADGRDQHHRGRIDVKVVLDEAAHREVAQERRQQPDAKDRHNRTDDLCTQNRKRCT